MFRALISTLFALCILAIPPGFAQSEDEREGGILGTGISNLGIIGTITQLGSIYVNGQHIRFDAKLEVADGSSVQFARALQPGHTVAVIATPDPKQDGDWRAQHIRQIAPLVGPLNISRSGALTVLGTEVTPPAGFTPPQDRWVAVSGLWQNNRVIASRIDLLDSSGHARIEGSVQQLADRVRIGTTDITGLTPHHLNDGDVIRVTGQPNPSGLTVASLETGAFDTPPGVTLVEGYLSPPAPTGRYTVLGSGLVSFTDNPAMIDPLLRVFACGDGSRLIEMQSLDSPPTCHISPQD